jgi:hypothetical protein
MSQKLFTLDEIDRAMRRVDDATETAEFPISAERWRAMVIGELGQAAGQTGPLSNCPYCGSDNITDVIDYHRDDGPDLSECLDCMNTWEEPTAPTPSPICPACIARLEAALQAALQAAGIDQTGLVADLRDLLLSQLSLRYLTIADVEKANPHAYRLLLSLTGNADLATAPTIVNAVTFSDGSRLVIHVEAPAGGDGGDAASRAYYRIWPELERIEADE